jgi:RNA polymerase sigma factor (sigma-70 family)
MEPMNEGVMNRTAVADDGELLRLYAAQRSEWAFAELVERHAGWVFASALRQLRDVHLAEDATQAVFCLLTQKANQLKAPGRLSGWLFNAVHYTVRNQRRARRRRDWHERRAAWKADRMADESEASRELAGRLDRAVAALCATDRDAVLLRFYRNLTFERVAESMGTTEAAARKRVARAVVRLRRRLGPELNEASLGCAAAFGLNRLPATLIGRISDAAGSRAGSALAAKGGLAIMATANTKIAAVAVVVLFLIAVPTGWLTIHYLRQPQPQIVASGTQAVVQDAAHLYYALKPGEFLRAASNVPAAARLAWYQSKPQSRYERDNLPTAMTIRWNGDNTEFWGATWGAGGSTLSGVLSYLFDLDNTQLEGDISALNVPGDVVIRLGGTPRQYQACLAQLLIAQWGPGTRVDFPVHNQNAIVLQGRWKYVPVTQPSQTPPRRHTIEFYTHELDDPDRGGGGSGNVHGFGHALAEHIGQSVVIEGQNIPHNISWHYNDRPAENTPGDLKLLLDHLQQQTGLTWSRQVRAIPHLAIHRGN